MYIRILYIFNDFKAFFWGHMIWIYSKIEHRLVERSVPGKTSSGKAHSC